MLSATLLPTSFLLIFRAMKINHLSQLYNLLPEEERLIVDVLRQIVKNTLPQYCKEKLSFNVPYFYGHQGICIIWPSTIPRGGVKQGVLFGFWKGHLLRDEDNYLEKGSNKKVYYKIFQKAEDIDEEALVKLLLYAIDLDRRSFQ